ncbi:hypothetical protein [Shewanella sp. GutDb-MelDb]|uniref:hypothetical protein n=1 Tax=Shewanella sp. GutDb-MelDb TaxID=2058316 RepID=UPI000C7E5556|nr:hypothetical protein [Shewanella sp. GutDb-MelDb]PKG57738.1 hypothetical protein CXF82_08165 [Shewanella sp. GutDb-MelDb]
MTELATWLMVAIAFISLVLTILVPLLVSLFSAHKNTTKELSDHKTHVAENYATKDDVKELGDRMERQMRDGFNNLKDLLTTNKDKDAA